MTPEEYAELNGAYPDAPNNPTPSTTGFMDNGGFAWAGKNAEIEDVSDSMAVITNKFDDMVGAIEVDDDKDDDEVVEVSIQDDELNEIGSYTLDDGVIIPYDDYDPRYSMMAESLVEEPAWIPAGDGRAIGQQNFGINMSPLHAESFAADGLKAFAKKIENEKNKLIRKAKRSGLYENFGEKESRKLKDSIAHLDYYEEEEYRKLILVFDEWCQNYWGAESQESMILEACGICDNEFNAETLNADGYCSSCCDTRLAEFEAHDVKCECGTTIGTDEEIYMNSVPFEVIDIEDGWKVVCMNCAKSFNAESKRPHGMTSTRFRHKETGEIATRIPISEMRMWEKLDAETTGSPSPTFNEDITGQDGPETEPTNSNFSAESGISWGKLFIGSAALILGGGLLANKQGWVGNADDDIEPIEDIPPPSDDADTLVENPDTGDLLTGDYEEMVVQSTGYAVPVIPMSLDGSFMGSRFQALPTDRYVDYNEPGIGAHTDVAMERNTKYLTPAADLVRMNSEDCGCSFFQRIKAFFTGESCDCDEETDVKESQGVGQSPYFQMGKEPVDMDYRVIKEVSPKGLDPAAVRYMPTDWIGQTGQAYVPDSLYGTMYDLGVAGIHPTFNTPNESSTGANRMGDRMAQPDTLSNVVGPLSVGSNASYTDGGETKTLAQWGMENQVSQISDSEAVVVSHTSGVRKMIRRV